VAVSIFIQFREEFHRVPTTKMWFLLVVVSETPQIVGR